MFFSFNVPKEILIAIITRFTCSQKHLNTKQMYLFWSLLLVVSIYLIWKHTS